jgi:SSS family solute:Na+ symporter
MLGTIDWIVIIGYFALIAGIAWWSIRTQKQQTTDKYFLAGRHLDWFIVGASIFASNIGS